MINDDMIPSFGIENINPNDPNVDYLDKDCVESPTIEKINIT